MARVKLTDRFVKTVRPPASGRAEYFDTGKTGLVLRVTARGVKAWSVYDRLKSGAKFRHTIGHYPQVSLAQAHKATEVALEQVRGGDDPRAVKAAAEASKAEREADTVANIGRQFIAKHAATRRWPELQRIIERDVIPRWGDRPMTSITRRDVRELVEDVAERAPVQANRTLTVLRIFFRWAAKRDVVPGDPTTGIDKTEERPRTRRFSDPEVRAFWLGCNRLGWPFGDCFKLLLLTAARKSEVSGGHWSEIDRQQRLWEVPFERTKNKQPNVIPLSASAIAVIDALQRIGERPDLIFTTNGQTPISGFSKAKAALDAYMLEELRRGDPEAKLEDWRIHDLRRTVRTNLTKLGVATDVAERVLSHAITGIRKVYDAHDFLQEKRNALERWAVHVAGVVSPQPNKVVKLKRKVQR